jgi:hypothetical protein
MSDNLTSLLINRQVPEFVREEYPLFVTFLEAYYEFLEQKQGTQLNDLITRSKDLRYISDVDQSIDDFEESFFNSYAELIPRNLQVDKAILIKNVLPLYLSKGSEASFKLLYRFLFGQELEVRYPKNDILRASDGKWEIENALEVSADFYAYHTANGTNKEFKILQELNPSDISVFVNGDLKVLNTHYFVRKQSKKIVFITAPANQSVVKILHKTLDTRIFNNRKVTGEVSGATALIERVSNKIINQQAVFEFFIDSKTLIDSFTNGENILLDVFVDDILVDVVVATISNLLRVNIIDGGASYNVGDPVLFTTPVFDVAPTAIVSKTFAGVIDRVLIADGGSGFMDNERIAAVGYSNTQLDFVMTEINTNSSNTANVFRIFSDVISDVDPANTTLSVSNWKFPGNIAPSGMINVNSQISHAFSNATYVQIGEISEVSIAAAVVVPLTQPVLNATPAYITLAPLTANTLSNTVVSIDTFGSLGKLYVSNPGSGYAVFEELTFTSPPNSMSYGFGAEAIISKVSVTGSIVEAKFVPSKITGTANVTSVSNVMVHGIGTLFTTELVVGDSITIGHDTRKIISIASNTSLNVTSAAWSQIYSSLPVRKVGLNLIGGQGYKQNHLPTVTINTVAGFEGTIRVTGILGDGEDLIAKGSKRPGEIEEILVANSGIGIRVVPSVDLSGFGDGTATANVTLNPSFITTPGRWTTSDSILSSLDRRIQGRNYYVNYSYLLSSTTEFAKYKKVFRDLLHPAGFKAYAELTISNEIATTPAILETLVAPTTIKTLSGRVNVANVSIYVTGSNTKFNVANSLGIISIGSYIAVNSQIRVVSSIISNTNLAVTSAFTITANNEELLVVNTIYDAVATEITLEEILAENELPLTVES